MLSKWFDIEFKTADGTLHKHRKVSFWDCRQVKFVVENLRGKFISIKDSSEDEKELS